VFALSSVESSRLSLQGLIIVDAKRAARQDALDDATADRIRFQEPARTDRPG
jgi:hypothetical protein